MELAERVFVSSCEKGDMVGVQEALNVGKYSFSSSLLFSF